MFMQRFITTLILVPIVLCMLFYAPPWFLGGVAALILVAAARECWQLIPIKNPYVQWGSLILLVAGFWFCGLVFQYWLFLGVGVWILNSIAVLTFPASQKYWGHPGIIAAICFIILPLCFQSLVHIYYLPRGTVLLTYVLFLVWASDIGAYITGKCVGAHKLIPHVSPGKSWEGVLGGYVLATVVSCLSFVFLKPGSIVLWLGVALTTVLISIFGDLFISILKRRAHLKDTGTLIPGHGGVLDRLDSLIAALPLFYLGLKVLFYTTTN